MADNRSRSKKSPAQSVIDLSMGKMPPQVPELEEAVLGALLLEKDAFSIVSEILKPECFYKESHQHIYEAIVMLCTKEQPVDMLTVTEELRRLGKPN
jgi:replicative DNA helicase